MGKRFCGTFFSHYRILCNLPPPARRGRHIKKIRKEKGLTQDDVGFNGISRQMISHLELAISDTTVTKLKALADNLEVKVKDLFNFE